MLGRIVGKQQVIRLLVVCPSLRPAIQKDQGKIREALTTDHHLLIEPPEGDSGRIPSLDPRKGDVFFRCFMGCLAFSRYATRFRTAPGEPGIAE
jgi:hypothetical protein